MSNRLIAASAALALILPNAALAQRPTQPPTGGQRPTFPGGFPGAGAPAAPAGKPRPYADVITKDAKSSKPGLFTTHQVDTNYYFEVPMSVLGKELLWVTTLERSPSFTGMVFSRESNKRVFRLERRGDKILIRGVNYTYRVLDKKADMERALATANIEPILAVLDIKAYGDKESSVVLDASQFYNGDLAGGTRFDSSKTFVESMKAFPQNVIVKVTGTRAGGGGAPVSIPGLNLGGGGGAETVVVNHQVVLLPEKPMLPRLVDSRVGFFTEGFTELGNAANRVKDVSYISKWRLEKKDPSAKVSEPVKPITYYLSNEIPDKWKPYVKKGILEWNKVFAKAGFKDAVVCREYPMKEEDPDFDPEDIRYTVVRWLPSGVENAVGPHLSDPRTGEILNGSPLLYYNVLKLAQNWYFVQAGPNDRRAQKLPLSDDLTGDLLAYVVTHEVGHTLGLRHNHGSSQAYTVKQLRDPKFTAQFGTAPSIMDYARNNYVAQPEDKVTQLAPKIGPYDYFAIEWGYAPIPGATTPEAELPALNALASKQSTDPRLRFGGAMESGRTEDPGQQTEDLTNDPVEATRLGHKNLSRVLDYLVSATTKSGEDFSLLEETYGEVLGQRQRELGHVLTVVGGVREVDYHAGQSKNPNFAPVPRAQQKAAVQLLNDLVFKTSPILTRKEITSRYQPSGVMARVAGEQRGILGSLVRDDRLTRMLEVQTLYPAVAYPVEELLHDLNAAVFAELGSSKVTTDLYRRNLQRSYLAVLTAKFDPPVAAAAPADGGGRRRPGGGAVAGPAGEVKALVRGALTDVRASLVAAKGKTADRATLLHLIDSIKVIDETLEPNK